MMLTTRQKFRSNSNTRKDIMKQLPSTILLIVSIVLSPSRDGGNSVWLGAAFVVPSSSSLCCLRHVTVTKYNKHRPTTPLPTTTTTTPIVSFQTHPLTRLQASATTTTAATPLVGYFYMACLALQFAFQPILTKKYAPNNIVRTTYVLAQECVRLIIGTALLVATGSWSRAVHDWTGMAALIAVGFPSILYLLQNYCSLMAYQHLPPITYNVLNQTKTLSAAIFCYFLLGQMQSPLQMVALLILLLSALVMESIVPLPFGLEKGTGGSSKKKQKIGDIGSAISSTAESNDENQDSAINTTTTTTISAQESSKDYLLFGLIPIFAASSISGLAGAWVQKSLKQRNSLLFSVELAALSIVILLVRLAVNATLALWNDSSSASGKKNESSSNNKNNNSSSSTMTTTTTTTTKVHWTSGWTWQTWIPVWTNASGGILVGLVTKHAGAVRKGFALILGMFLSGVLQNVLFSKDKRVTLHQWVGGALAAISLWMHSSYPHR